MLDFDKVLTAGLGIIDKFIPDKQKQAEFEAEYRKALLDANNQQAIAQTEINKVEAASDDKYTSRARPTIMYICGIGFGYQYILQPFIVLILHHYGSDIIAPTLDMTAIGTLLLGLCGLRSFDKYTINK